MSVIAVWRVRPKSSTFFKWCDHTEQVLATIWLVTNKQESSAGVVPSTVVIMQASELLKFGDVSWGNVCLVLKRMELDGTLQIHFEKLSLSRNLGLVTQYNLQTILWAFSCRNYFLSTQLPPPTASPHKRKRAAFHGRQARAPVGARCKLPPSFAEL